METETLNPQIEESAEMTEAAEPSEVEVLGEEEQEVAEPAEEVVTGEEEQELLFCTLYFICR